MKPIQLKIWNDDEIPSIKKDEEREEVINLDYLLRYTDKNEMPIVKRYTGEIPHNIVGINRVLAQNRIDCSPHFFVADQNFETIWTHKRTYHKKLGKYPCVISPDFSMYVNMLEKEKQWNLFRNHYIAALWQKFGLNVIPNVSWTSGECMKYFTEGMPTKSVIAINSTGLGNDKMAKKIWQEGYQIAIEQLQPIHIIRYGTRQPNEKEEISTYFGNDNYRSFKGTLFQAKRINK